MFGTKTSKANLEKKLLVALDDPENQNTSWPVSLFTDSKRCDVLSILEGSYEKILDATFEYGVFADCLSKNSKYIDVLYKTNEEKQIIQKRTSKKFINELKINQAEKNKYDLIIISDLLNGWDGQSSLVKKLKDNLTSSGKILLLSNNRMSLQYITGMPGIHSGKLFDVNDKNLATKANIDLLCKNVGLSTKFYSAFPNYFFATEIFSEDMINKKLSPSTPTALPTPSPFFEREYTVNEKELFYQLQDQGLAFTFSNSFVVLCEVKK